MPITPNKTVLTTSVKWLLFDTDFVSVLVLLLSSNAELVCTINLAKFIANILFIKYLKKDNNYKLIAVSYLNLNVRV